MPGYGLPESKRGLRPWSWAERVLRDGHNYWVATVRPGGRPHAMPVWAVWRGGALWFSTGAGSRKAKNLGKRGICSVGVERGTRAVIVEGIATRLASAAAPAGLAAAYRRKYGGGYPDDSLLFRVEPRVVFGFSEEGDEFGETATRWVFARS
jgi:hypothetical protein